MSTRAGALCLVLTLPAVGCLSAGRGASGREGMDLLDQQDYEAASSTYERAAALAADPEEKARAYVGLGRAQLGARDPRKALKTFYEARRLHYDGVVASGINRGIGAAYFCLGDYALARRYLSKGMESAGPERDLMIAKLVICCRAMEDVAGAAAYRDRLSQPLGQDVKEILAMEPRAGHPSAFIHACPDDEKDETEHKESGLARPESVGPQKPREEEPQPESQDRLRVYSRSSWSARAPRRNIEPMGRVDKITVHHSGGENFWGSAPSDAAAEIRRIQRYHQNEQGWADIGYHYIIDRNGAVWQGRRLRYQGAHARGPANNGNIGVVVLGNYMYQGLTSPQRQSLEAIIEKLCEHFSIAPQRVYTHREILGGRTECPGPALARCVSEIRTSLRRRLVAYRP